MATGNFEVYSAFIGSGVRLVGHVLWTSTANAATNTSDVTVRLCVRKGYNYTVVAVPTTGHWFYSLNIGGTPHSGNLSASVADSDVLLFETRVTVAHAADGSMALPIRASVTGPTETTMEGVTASGSGTAQLDTIPRTSVPTLSADTIILGESVTISTNRVAGSGFTHVLYYAFGNTSGLIAGGVEDSCVWTPTADLFAQHPNASAGWGVIVCETYSGSTQIGGRTTASFKLEASQLLAPVVSAAYTDISGAHTALGVYARYISALQGSIEAQGQYGSTITAYSATVDDRTYTGKSFTSSTLIGHGHLVLTVSATDSRGLTGSASYDIWTHAYFLPALTLNASRCREDGTADDTGDHVKITVTGQVCDVNGVNTGTLTVTAGGEQVAALCTSVTPGEDFILEHILPVDTEISLPITATLADKLRSTSRRMTLSIGFVTMDIHAGGKGIGFGAEAPKEGFALGMDTDMCGKRLDGVGVINGALVGAVSADPGTEVKIPLGDTKGVMLVGLCGDAGAYGVYALTFADSATLSTPVQLSGSGVQPQFFVHTPGELTVTGLVGGTTGWYIGMGQPGDH